ncbi:hypothetical protein H4W79_001480 [Nocardiopsis terrae]|uniref:Uncharacterized protein n=1 Tax=Nocardiopsis terrae TaxID=372655 RepID=A0ABR9HE07_9ACTN|nr:hypothetical protein [Nocardiopsis terrae]MBE1457266.1 hypothetical protein [Nocardiopsis terrae]
MSTSSEDTPSTTVPSDADGAPESPGSESPDASAAGEAFLSGRSAQPRSGLFGPETFSVTGLLFLATTLLSTQLVRIFNQQTLTGAEGSLTYEVQGELTGAGLFSALAVVCAAVALVRADPGTRAWARHLAAATVLVGVVLVVLTVLSYVLLTGA